MSNSLYHFFPRKFESEEQTIAIAKSILENGLFLSHEMLKVNWKDLYATGAASRVLAAEQFRLCLTAVSNETELKMHSGTFGRIGLEFSEDFIIKIGGFPVFYVPTPNNEQASLEEYKGVSLLYRLAEAQQILELIATTNVIQTKDIDIKNVLGAIKFLANICYPTQRLPNNNSKQAYYYNQREWRVIYHLTHANVTIGHHNNNHTISAFNNEPLRNFIKKIVVFNNQSADLKLCQNMAMKLKQMVDHFEMNCQVALINQEVN